MRNTHTAPKPAPAKPDPAADRAIKLPEVKHKTSLSKSKIYALMKEAKFPACTKWGRSSVWSERAVDAWISASLRRLH